MATLTPEMLKLLMSGGQAEYYDPATGRAYLPDNGSGWTSGGGYMGEDGSFQAAAPTEFRGYNWTPEMNKTNEELNGTPYDIYNTQGEQTGTGTWDSLGGQVPNWLPFAMLAAPFAAAMSPALGSAMSFGTNPVLGGASGFAPGMAGAAGGAMGGAAPATNVMGAGSSGTGLQMGGSQLGLSASAGPGMTLGAGPTIGMSGASPGAGAIGGGLGMSEFAAGTGSLLGPTALGQAGSAVSNAAAAKAAAEGASKWLGPAATALGALAGGQGQKTSETTARDIPEWLKPSVEKLLGYSGGLLDKQMAPGYMQGYDDMRTRGQGLLAQPIAGNGFSRFFPGR